MNSSVFTRTELLFLNLKNCRNTNEDQEMIFEQQNKEMVYGEIMFQTTFMVISQSEGDIIDITPQVKKVVRDSKVTEGIIHLFVRHSTAALTTIEFEPVYFPISGELSPFLPRIMQGMLIMHAGATVMAAHM